MTDPTLLLAAALALSPLEEPAPTGMAQPLMLQCSEAQTAGRLMRMVLGSGALPLFARSPAASLLPLLMEPARAAAAGIDVAAPLRLSLGPQTQGALDLGLLPGWTLDAPQRAALGLGDLQAAGWTLATEGDRLRLASAPPPTALPPIQAAPDPGCTLSAELGPEPDDGVWVFIPADLAQPLRLMATSPLPLPPLLMETPVEPVSGSSVAPPDLVLTLGLSPEALFSALKEAGAPAPPGLDGGSWTSLSQSVQIGPGSTLALWLRPEGPRFALSIPWQRGAGRALPVRAARKRLQAALAPRVASVTREGRDQLRVVLRRGSLPLVLVVQPDRLLLGTEARAVADSAAGRGPAWVDPTLARLARLAPLALQSNLEVVQAGGVAPAAPLRLGVQVRGDQIELLVLADDAALVPQLMGLDQLRGRLERSSRVR